MKKNRIRSKALILVMALLFQTIAYIPKASAAPSAESTGQVLLGSAALTQKQVLKDNGDGTFTMQLTLDANLSATDRNENATVSRNYYYTAPYSGDYLIQLWGGAGAAGSDTSYSQGGRGGNGGYVYGKIRLEAGETLYYQLGGNGAQTQAEDQGGGINGDGGGHGDTGSLMVGGGGGYSAVYKFDALEFEKKYTDGNGNITTEISTEDRATKYILIAGGGGGGGAGNGISPLLGVTAVGTADGGAAGTVGSASGVLSGSGYDVEGTFFAGENGKSSGTSTNFVGRGGTNVPGEINATLLGGLFDLFQGKQPNDWRGTANETFAGGSGGSGNLRGGGGGAGFCGGSGGVQAGLLSAYSIGGGGGGSSFIADSVTYTRIDDVLASKGLPENPSTNGGAVHIVALDAAEHLRYLSNVSLSGTVSRYFNVDSRDSNVTTNGTGFTTSGLDLAADGSVTLTLVLTPRPGFMGGNNVPMWDGGIRCETTDDRTYSAEIPISSVCGYANVPLQGFVVNTTDFKSNTSPVVRESALMYDDTYQGEIPGGDEGWKYDFIQDITPYYIRDSHGNDLTGTTLETASTTRYTVGYTVTPKNNAGYAAVGERIESTAFSALATITIVPPGSGELNGNELFIQKELAWNNDGTYTFSANVTSTALPGTTAVSDPFVATSAASYTVPSDGYYYIQAWGAKGGNGGNALFGGNGGTGATGSYAAGYIWLEAGTLTISCGAVGNNSANGSGIGNKGGAGGGATGIKTSTGDYFLIAGGGGGGGGASNGDDGYSAAPYTGAPTPVSENQASLADYAGSPGGKGGWGGSIGSAGTSNPGCYNKTIVNVQPNGAPALTASVSGFNSSDKPSAAGDAGAVIITPLQMNSVAADDTKLTGYTLELELSRYFEVADISAVTLSDATGSFSLDASGETTIVTVSGIVPAAITLNADSSKSIDYTLNVTFRPRDGFLGGNDVPVLQDNGILGYDTGMRITQGSDYDDVYEADAADYANVAISDLRDYASITAKEHTITAGGSVNTTDMYGIVWLRTLPTGWEDDFVTLTQTLTQKGSTSPITSSAVSPQVTTWYTMTLALAPNAAPTKATIVTEAETNALPCEPVIYVLPRVVYDLAHLTTSETLDSANGVTIAVGEDYTATLTADAAYALPAAITVTRNDGTTLVPGTDYTYDAASGTLTVYASAIGTRQITITATAPLKTHTLTYYCESAPGVSAIPDTDEFYPGDSIQNTAPFTHDPADVDGYSYVQSWEVDGKAIEWVIGPERAERPSGIPDSMPHSDVWVFGHYKPNDYTLTVNYYYKDTTTAVAAPHEETVAFGSSYGVTSPVISGYLADSAVVSGTMGAGNTTINVYYTATANQLNILYFKTLPNGALEQFDSHTSTVDTDAPYSVTSPALTGYTVAAGKETVTGVMTAEGVTVQVVYTPNSYAVTLDPAGGTCTKSSVTVAYDNVYGYVCQGGAWEYDSLPTPVRVGYTFQGWYLDGLKVTETTKVTNASDHTLVAKWEGQKFQYMIRHVYADGASVNDGAYDVRLSVAVGDSVPPENYTAVPALDGYTADKTRAELETTMVAQNMVITITYTSNYRTLTVHYRYADTVADADKRGTEAAASHIQTFDVVKPDVLTYSVKSPSVSGYAASQETVSGVMGTEDVTLTVYYYDRAPIVSVTVTWGELTYEYTHGTWNPYTHTYSTEIIRPTAAGKNTVAVANNAESEISINAQFSYTANSGYETVSHFFTAADNMAAANITQTGTLYSGHAKTAWLWLQGTLSRDAVTGESGLCTVTITGGG